MVFEFRTRNTPGSDSRCRSSIASCRDIGPKNQLNTDEKKIKGDTIILLIHIDSWIIYRVLI